VEGVAELEDLRAVGTGFVRIRMISWDQEPLPGDQRLVTKPKLASHDIVSAVGAMAVAKELVPRREQML
jgi:hypothetical protein